MTGGSKQPKSVHESLKFFSIRNENILLFKFFLCHSSYSLNLGLFFFKLTQNELNLKIDGSDWFPGMPDDI